jgi:hypothetical protein
MLPSNQLRALLYRRRVAGGTEGDALNGKECCHQALVLAGLQRVIKRLPFFSG